MRSQTNEEALESSIESSLLNNGFYKGEPSDFNKEYAIDEKRFWHFLENTQEEELNKLKRDTNYKLKIIQRLGVCRVTNSF
jgi:type I restriction enzyme R subunit